MSEEQNNIPDKPDPNYHDERDEMSRRVPIEPQDHIPDVGKKVEPMEFVAETRKALRKNERYHSGFWHTQKLVKACEIITGLKEKLEQTETTLHLRMKCEADTDKAYLKLERETEQLQSQLSEAKAEIERLKQALVDVGIDALKMKQILMHLK